MAAVDPGFVSDSLISTSDLDIVTAESGYDDPALYDVGVDDALAFPETTLISALISCHWPPLVEVPSPPEVSDLEEKLSVNELSPALISFAIELNNILIHYAFKSP